MTQATLFDAENVINTILAKAEYGDVCARKHKGNARSIEANQRVDKAKQSEQILRQLTLRPMTALEVADALNVAAHKISGRFKALRELRKIEFTGEKREGSNEYRIAR